MFSRELTTLGGNLCLIQFGDSSRVGVDRDEPLNVSRKKKVRNPHSLVLIISPSCFDHGF